MQRTISITLILLMMFGCSRAVEVPQEQFAIAGATAETTHRIRMTTNAEYVARWFSVTDSTIVISELSPADQNFRLRKPPITLRLDEVESVARMEPNRVAPVVVIGTVFVLVWAVTTASGGYGSN